MTARIYTPTDRISRHYGQRAKQILTAFEDIRALMTHEGAKGARVEEKVREFLVRFLPERYQYASGIVIDSSGAERDFSRQQDVLIVDKLYSPKLFLDEEPSVYPVDVVYCGIQVKTCLDEGEMHLAVQNIASLKRLRFISDSVAYAGSGGVQFRSTTPPIGVIFAFDTAVRKAETLLEHLHEAVKEQPRAVWPELICVLNRGLMGFVRGDKPALLLYGLLGQNDTRPPAEVIATAPTPSFDYGGQRYPTVEATGKNYVVDVGRTFMGFLDNLYESLLSKVLIGHANLLHHYTPELMRRCVLIQAPTQPAS